MLDHRAFVSCAPVIRHLHHRRRSLRTVVSDLLPKSHTTCSPASSDRANCVFHLSRHSRNAWRRLHLAVTAFLRTRCTDLVFLTFFCESFRFRCIEIFSDSVRPRRFTLTVGIHKFLFLPSVYARSDLATARCRGSCAKFLYVDRFMDRPTERSRLFAQLGNYQHRFSLLCGKIAKECSSFGNTERSAVWTAQLAKRSGQ